MDGNDLKELRELVEFLKASGVEEFEMERPDLKVGLKFAGETPVAAATPAGFDMAQLAALMAAQRGSAPAPAAVAAPAASAPAAVVPAAEVDPPAGADI